MVRVSVIFPVYNGAKYIRTSVRSILEQSFREFELLLINDGSTDETPDILKEFTDPRIRIINNKKNSGLIFSLNRGISEAKGEYLARMDADDESLPNRFAEQVRFLDLHKDVDICGTLMTCFITDRIYQHRYFNSEDVGAALVFTNPIVHPSVMMRRSIFTEESVQYNSNYPHAEDYAMWVQLVGKHKFAILNSVLIRYGAHDDQMSRKFNSVTRNSVIKAHRMIFEALNIDASEEESSIHAALFFEDYRNEKSFVKSAEKWLLKLTSSNRQQKIFSTPAFEKLAGEWWFRIHQHLAAYGSGGYSSYKKSPLSSMYQPTTKSLIKLRIKSILKTKA